MKTLMLLLLLSFTSYVNANNCQSLEAMDWLLGSWQVTENNKIITESWQQVSANTIEGVGLTYVGEVLKSSESMRIVEMSGSIFYVAKVTHNALPVAFTLTTCTDNILVFENANHDFPKRIEYTLITDNELKAHVSDGKNKGFSIHFTRAQSVKH